jgi:MFS family permease
LDHKQLFSAVKINQFRNNIFLANAVAIVFGCLIYVRNFPMLIICRFFQGFAVGILSSITPLMLREFSPNEMAGSLGSFTEFHISIGSLIGSFFPYILLKITGDLEAKAYWYYVFAFPQTIIVLQTILLIFVFPY